MANRVRKNATYILDPVLLDYEYLAYRGVEVRVIELPGCPRSKMPKCFAHVETARTHHVIGMVHTNSLTRKDDPRWFDNRNWYRKVS